MTPMTALLSLVAPLSASAPDPSKVGQGWIGFVVFLGLAAAVVLLWLSFRKQLKKVDFEEEPDAPRDEQDGAGA